MENYARVIDPYHIHLRIPIESEGFEDRIAELFPDLSIRHVCLQGYTHRVELDDHTRNIKRIASLIGSLLSSGTPKHYKPQSK